MQVMDTCRAALKMQKGMSARSLKRLKSGSFTTCCSLSQPISTSGSLSSILCQSTELHTGLHILTSRMQGRSSRDLLCEHLPAHQHAHAPLLACPSERPRPL